MTNLVSEPARAEVYPERGSLLYFTVVCFIAALGGLLFGFDTAVVSGVDDILKTQFQLGEMMEGWVISSALVGCMIGAGVGGWLSDQFGRKKTLLFSALLFMVTALLCAVAPDPHWLTLPRLIGGIGVGVASMAVPLYIAEISPPRLRGRMVSFYQFAITIGVVLAYLSNASFYSLSGQSAGGTAASGLWKWMVVDEVWRGMLGSMFVPATCFFLLGFFVPESPRWLTKQGRDGEAMGILARVAGQREAQSAMAEIREAIAHEVGGLGELLHPGTRRALLMAVFLACAAQFSGINAIIYYGTKIIKDFGSDYNTALIGQVVLGLVNVAFTVLAMLYVDTMGRRRLLLIGNTGIFLSLLTVGMLYYFEVSNLYLLMLFISIYLACFAFSLGPLPWVFMSEVFPTRIRGRAMSIAAFSVWFSNTIVCQTFPWLQKHYRTETFWIYAAMVAPVFLFVWRWMPETKGRTLEEIEASWERPT